MPEAASSRNSERLPASWLGAGASPPSHGKLADSSHFLSLSLDAVAAIFPPTLMFPLWRLFSVGMGVPESGIMRANIY